MGSDAIRVLSWNVNGLRACDRHGFRKQLRRLRPDIFAVQEVRARPEQLEPGLRRPRGWHTNFVVAQRKGYSGVGLYSRHPPDAVISSMDAPRFDREGRVQLARFGRLVIVNAYFPNGNGQNRDNSRVPYKLAFYRRLFDVVQARRRGGYRVLVMGDFNTAPEEIDLARPKGNPKTSGFLPNERAELRRWIDAGWVDTFRAFEPGPGHYTWWATRLQLRQRNVGWRIDHVLASPAAMRYVQDAFIRPEVMGSDHCPVGVTLDPAIFGPSGFHP